MYKYITCTIVIILNLVYFIYLFTNPWKMCDISQHSELRSYICIQQYICIVSLNAISFCIAIFIIIGYLKNPKFKNINEILV